MIPTLSFLGKTIPIYGLCWLGGILLAALLALLICRLYHIDLFDLTCAAVYSMIGAILGSKLLFIAVSLPQIIEYRLSFFEIIRGGFVFYGGLLGGILGLYIYTKQFRLPFSAYGDLFATVTPLGHALGRIGCLIGGCCYGLPYDGPFAWTYTATIGQTPLNTPLFPIQLLEAALLLILCGVLLVIRLRKAPIGRNITVYLVGYAVMRFCLEFFRGDRERGVLWVLSTSQIISLGIIVAVCLCRWMHQKATRRQDNRSDTE